MIFSMIRYFFNKLGFAVLSTILSVLCGKKDLNRRECAELFAKGCKEFFINKFV
jgi:hypothetical protein